MKIQDAFIESVKQHGIVFSPTPRYALSRLGLGGYGVEDWLAADPPTFDFPTWRVRYRPFDWAWD